MSGKCDADVFENGQSVFVVDIPKETAENICKNLSAVTWLKIDWHYIGGRVHIKALDDRGGERQPVAIDERAEFESWIVGEWPLAPLRYVRDALPEDDPLHGTYCDEYLQRAWVGWQARACLGKVKELNQ